MCIFPSSEYNLATCTRNVKVKCTCIVQILLNEVLAALFTTHTARTGWLNGMQELECLMRSATWPMQSG